jgi:hypothetical protein
MQLKRKIRVELKLHGFLLCSFSEKQPPALLVRIEIFRYKKISLYYRVVVYKAPLQGLCYTVMDAVDW